MYPLEMSIIGMKIKILSPLWGHENIKMETFLNKVRKTGYDGFDTWLPNETSEKNLLFNYLQKHEMYLVCHQHEASGSTFKRFKASYIQNLKSCAVPEPILINSHTGRDFFTFEQNLELIDAAAEFSERTGIQVVHETHRGRLGYSPQSTAEFFKKRKNFNITADFSHWVCVTESMLENFEPIVEEAISRSRHIHARVGYEEGPQITDPRAPEWQYAVKRFLHWWDAIIKANNKMNCSIFPITTEFGPPPYMTSIPFTRKPLVNQFEINCYMKDLLQERYSKWVV
jgi:sugar phosphate isomerase/epimerase